MLTNPFFRNKKTGELATGEEAIHRFYGIEKHRHPDCWTDEWEETNLDADEGLTEEEKAKNLERVLDNILVAFGL